MHQRDSEGAAVRADVEEVGQRANLLDTDEEAGLLGAPGRGVGRSALLAALLLRRRHFGDCFGLDTSEVRVVAGEVPAARVALVARPGGGIGVLAKEELGEALG